MPGVHSPRKRRSHPGGTGGSLLGVSLIAPHEEPAAGSTFAAASAAGSNSGALMMTWSGDREVGDLVSKAGKAVKWAFVAFLATAAGVIAFFHLFRTHPAEKTLLEAAKTVERGDAGEVMGYVDPEGQIGTMWRENTGGMRDSLQQLLDRYRLEFSSLKFKTRAEKEYAEAQVVGGRLTVYERASPGPPVAVLYLDQSDLVFYLQKKEGRWLIEGVNYDLPQVLSSEGGVFPPW